MFLTPHVLNSSKLKLIGKFSLPAFFILYATFRIVAEQFREPDSAWVIDGILTKGQFYSIFMYVIGAAFLVAGLRRKNGSLLDAPVRKDAPERS